MNQLPKCQTGAGAQCFNEVKINVEKGIELKPCTKLQYKVESSTWMLDQKNQAIFKLKFLTPPRVTVKEEYLIYDMVAVVSAIGGTMSLCIGFSFRDFFSFLLNYVELVSFRKSK